MSMVLVSEVFVAIVHILAGIDVEILLLGICNLENISLDGGGVLSKVGTDEWFEPEAGEPGDLVVSQHSVVKGTKLVSITEAEVVGE